MSLKCENVIANDIDNKKIKLSKNNLQVYNTGRNVIFFNQDYLKLNLSMKIDAILLCPPWGGCNYKDKSYFDL